MTACAVNESLLEDTVSDATAYQSQQVSHKGQLQQCWLAIVAQVCPNSARTFWSILLPVSCIPAF